MKRFRQRIRSVYTLLLLFVFTCSPLFLSGEMFAETPDSNGEQIAECINDRCTIKAGKEALSPDLLDDSEKTYQNFQEGVVVEVSSPEPISGLYIKFDRTPPKWMLKINKQKNICGQHGFLHEYQPINLEDVKKLTLCFDEQVSICDIYIFSKGRLPSFVQVWRPASGQADILLFSTHSDDDQLFFAGAIPDAVARGAEMQVCYFTNHWNTHSRPHELLNGLWTCGLDRYPVIGALPDTVRTMSEEGALTDFENKGFNYDTILKMQVELLRKYKPQIILVHDIMGEYGHGAHILNSHICRDAVIAAGDSTKFPDSYREYGVWNTPKTYIHLYDQNKIECNIDTPLEYFGGKTAYQVSQEAFRCHISQLPSRYAKWLLGTEDAPITESGQFYNYSPKYFGLWRSTVGPDIQKTDFYENIVLLRDQIPDPGPEDIDAFNPLDPLPSSSNKNSRLFLWFSIAGTAVLSSSVTLFAAILILKRKKGAEKEISSDDETASLSLRR